MPSLAIGTATYSNVVVNVGNILSGPTGSVANGTVDSYDPGNNQLTVQSVNFGGNTYHNVVVTVAGLVSIGGVTGADSYNGTDLSISLVQAGGTVYDHVVVAEALSNVVSVAGGMPTFVPDTYNSLTNLLDISAVQVGNRVYTNVIVSVGQLLAVGGIYFTDQESILHSFSGNEYGGSGASGDGDLPAAGLIQGIDGNFFGTTYYGGQSGMGAVFKVSAAGVESVFYSFGTNSEDGSQPTAGLIQDDAGDLYGTTTGGGGWLQGTVFKVTAAGVETVLYSFGSNGSTDGALPEVGLIRGSDGDLYGTTEAGGAFNRGTVFKVTDAGIETVLYSFSGHGGQTGSMDGASPQASLIQGTDGTFYGTTSLGGAYDKGTVFKITAAGVETVLHSFSGNDGLSGSTDGAIPAAALVQASDGNFYGTASGGNYMEGTVFKITADGTESVLYSFTGGGAVTGSTDGAGPTGALVQGSDGKFYGTTSAGGTSGAGTAFKITRDGIETVVQNFNASGLTGGSMDGKNPAAGLALGNDGNFYGTTMSGGAYNKGSVFRLVDVVSNP
jgi:uncharacterized repeat protein (TIGR03803 family)